MIFTRKINFLVLILFMSTGCSNSNDMNLEATIDARVDKVISRIATATPQVFVHHTPQPTATPQIISQIIKPNDLYNQWRFSVPRISSSGGTGTGWAIEDGWIITNEHVVRDETTVIVTVPQANGTTKDIYGIVYGVDKKRDFAAVKINSNLNQLDPFKIFNRKYIT